MAKKIVVDNSQLTFNTISGAGKGANSATVASDMMTDGDLFSSPRTKIGRKGKDIDEELLSEEGAVVDGDQEVVSDSVYADPEYEILLAQADVTLPPSATTPVITREKGAGFFSSQAANWLAGTGVVVAGTGVGFALFGNDGDSVTATANNAPVFTSAATANVAENSTVVLTVAATDADLPAQTVTYSITGGADQLLFAIDASTGALSFVAAPDFETPTDAGANNVYNVQVTANDGNGGTTAQSIAVTVVNEPPTITSGSTGSVAENAAISTVIYEAVATDADAGATITYSLKDATGDVAALDINTSTGEVTLKSSADFETKNSYSFTLIASDGTNSSEQGIIVNVTNNHENVVVKASGAWIDMNANGVRDAEDTIRADFNAGTGNVDLLANPVIIHYNAAPTKPLILTGFGLDDRIEIDAQAFIANGHHVLNILALPNIITLDAFTTYTSGSPNVNPTSTVYNTYTIINAGAGTGTGTSYVNSNRYLGLSNGLPNSLNAKIGLRLLDNNPATHTLLFFSISHSANQNLVLASGLPTDMLLQDVVDFVNLPVQSAIVHVVVDSNGAVIDIDGNGVQDIGENRLANFGIDGNADLAGKSVVIHFNDIPMSALNLTGFGLDDRIEIALGDSRLKAATYNTSAQAVSYQLTYLSGGFTVTSTLRIVQTLGIFTDLNLNQYNNVYGMTSPNAGFAYWNDASNALNTPTNLLPYPGQVEFIQSVNVVVDNGASFIDTNANGLRDGGEDTLALLGQTQADVDAFNFAASTSYISQAVDLASEQVTIHYNELPTGAWVPNLTGFDGNDKIAIDVGAMRLGSAKFIQNNSFARSLTDPVGLTVAYITTSFSYFSSAVFLNGSKLLFGHIVSGSYTASNINEGTIASNADALYQQQVVFVMSVGAPIQ